MKEIELTQGKTALCDDGIYEELNRFKWYAKKEKNTFYAVRHSPQNHNRLIWMHHEIIGVPPNRLMTDHRDRDGLNDQRYNLRHVTNRQNCQNQKKQKKKKTSKYPGVWWYEVRKRWIAQITIKGKLKWLGRFKDERKAFETYKREVEALGETVIESDNYVHR